MKKEVVEIEFRYHGEPQCSHDTGYRTDTVLIGVFDTIEEAVEKGNQAVKSLSKYFEVRDTDRFEVHGPVGCPLRLVSNCCYPTNGVSYFARISKVKVDELTDIVEKIFESAKGYKAWKEKEDNDN